MFHYCVGHEAIHMKSDPMEGSWGTRQSDPCRARTHTPIAPQPGQVQPKMPLISFSWCAMGTGHSSACSYLPGDSSHVYAAHPRQQRAQRPTHASMTTRVTLTASGTLDGDRQDCPINYRCRGDHHSALQMSPIVHFDTDKAVLMTHVC